MFGDETTSTILIRRRAVRSPDQLRHHCRAQEPRAGEVGRESLQTCGGGCRLR